MSTRLLSHLLLSHKAAAEHGADIRRRAETARAAVEIIALPEDRDARLPDAVCARIETAFFSVDVYPDFSRQFFSTVRKAPNLAWLHVWNAGVDHPVYVELLARGVRLTTSSGTAAEPIAQQAITGLLMLARDFPRWLADQRERKWNPSRGADVPRDLSDQTAVVLGVGHIGKAFARLARALGITVIGVRRSPRTPDDPVDEMHPPERLRDLVPRADWLVLACPLTPETRGLIDAGLISRLPAGARVINVARGEVVDEAAMIDALTSGRLAGAYLDVFQQEPLPPESPLWDLPNVIVTPHNAGAALGNDRRVYEVFLENLPRWLRKEPLLNEVAPEKNEEKKQ